MCIFLGVVNFATPCPRLIHFLQNACGVVSSHISKRGGLHDSHLRRTYALRIRIGTGCMNMNVESSLEIPGFRTLGFRLDPLHTIGNSVGYSTRVYFNTLSMYMEYR